MKEAQTEVRKSSAKIAHTPAESTCRVLQGRSVLVVENGWEWLRMVEVIKLWPLEPAPSAPPPTMWLTLKLLLLGVSFLKGWNGWIVTFERASGSLNIFGETSVGRPSQWRQVIIITRGHLCLLHASVRKGRTNCFFLVGWHTQENNLERNLNFACGCMYDDHGTSAKEQTKPDICQTPFHQKYFRENKSVLFLETKHVPQKTGNNLGHKVRNCVSPLHEHSWVCISVG